MGIDDQHWRVVNPYQPPLSLYIHFPWCIRKCPYCDFNSHELKNPLPENEYIQALLLDLEQDLALLGQVQPLQSIFMGGGTPSLFSPDSLDNLLAGIRKICSIATDAEITLEANPGTFEAAKFHDYRQLGINRLSIGIQSFNEQHLSRLGRIHNAQQAITAVEMAKSAGFSNFNLDLMFGLPSQTLAEAQADIATALSLKPTHISFYQLTLEPNTYFYKYPPKLPEDDSIFAIQKTCQQLLAAEAYQQYEISAYSLPGYQCLHNRNYWQFGDYLGIGAGAHGKLTQSTPDKIIRTSKPKHPVHFLKQRHLLAPQTIAIEQLPLEYLMNQLRLSDGFSLLDYYKHTGLNRDSLEPVLTECIKQNLLVEQQRIFCSSKGWDFLDVILEKFVTTQRKPGF